jgi:hypothetical protein
MCSNYCDEACTDVELWCRWKWTFRPQIYLTNQVHNTGI